MNEKLSLHRIERFVRLSKSADPDQRILSAWWEGERLVVASGAFETLRVPRKKIIDAVSPLAGTAKGDSLAEFEVDPNGLFLYWRDFDGHIGWEQFKQMVDPEASSKARREAKEFNERYGKAIGRLRKEKGIRPSAISGLDPARLRSIEKGECRATHSALGRLADAHGMSLTDYMDELAKRMAYAR